MPVEGGFTSGAGIYPSGSNVTAVATANPGYAFVNWSEGGSAVTNAASYSFVVGATNRALVANFAPLLSIALAAPDTVVLSWTATATGYVPWQNASLTPGTWGEMTNPVNVVGAQKQVLLSPLTGPAFYRLWHP